MGSPMLSSALDGLLVDKNGYKTMSFIISNVTVSWVIGVAMIPICAIAWQA